MKALYRRGLARLELEMLEGALTDMKAAQGLSADMHAGAGAGAGADQLLLKGLKRVRTALKTKDKRGNKLWELKHRIEAGQIGSCINDLADLSKQMGIGGEGEEK